MKPDFSSQFRPILEKAYSVANDLGSPVISSEHFVLAALREKDDYALKILRQLNVPIEKMKVTLEQHIRENQPGGESTTLFEQQYKITTSAIRHLQLAVAEARKMNINKS